MQYQYEHLIFVGRFQPPHNGHLAVMLRALTLARSLIVVIGSANKPRSLRNPFTEDERREMIIAAVSGVDASLSKRLRFVAVRDCYNDERWRAQVEDAVSGVAGTAGPIGVIGHLKDVSSNYLRGFRRWPLVEVDDTHALSSTGVRAVFFSEEYEQHGLEPLSASVPPAVLQFLRAFVAQPAYGELVEAYAWAQRESARWPRTPFPVIGHTVDVVIRCLGHVLMIKRNGQPGRGLWALPGGYVEEYELLRDAAVRELEEETGLAIAPGEIEKTLRGTHTFDYPWRSQRGRVITQAYYFELERDELPQVSGSDDAAEARWIPVGELAGLEKYVHDDHLHIVEHFLSGGRE